MKRGSDIHEYQETNKAEIEVHKPLYVPKFKVQDVHNVLYCDTKTINFNSYLPGKLLGSNLIVTNKTNCEQIIELSVDQQSYMYYKQDLACQFPETS